MSAGADLPLRGACFGYAVRSDHPLLTLRALPPQGGLEILDVRVRPARRRSPQQPADVEWEDGSGHVYCRLFRNGPTYDVWVDRAGWFSIDPARGSITAYTDDPDIRWETRLWGMPATLCMRLRGDVLLHAATVDVRGAAVLLAAPGFHGKTTLASAFLSAGHRLLGEDLASLDLRAIPRAHPGPALLRVRPDISDQLDLGETTVEAKDDDRVYLTVVEERRGDGAALPLAGLVLLRRSADVLALERVPGARSLADLWSLSFKLWDDEDRRRCWEGVSALAASVPVWDLRRPLTVDALSQVVDLVADRCVPG